MHTRLFLEAQVAHVTPAVCMAIMTGISNFCYISECWLEAEHLCNDGWRTQSKHCRAKALLAPPELPYEAGRP